MTRVRLVFSLLFCLPCLLYAGGKIRGRVTDKQSGDPLIGAHVVIVGTSYGTTADVRGEFSLVNIPVGIHTLRASFVGFLPMNLEGVRVLNELTTEIEFGLTVEAVTMQAITVVAEQPLINKSATNAFRVVTSDEIQAIPIRGVDDIVALQPGVVLQDGRLHIRGGRLDEVGFYLEGVSVTEPQYGGRAIALTQDAIEEVSVQSGGYEAEYGRANSGIVQYQLKTGGSKGKATFEYVTDNIALQPRSKAFTGDTRLGAYWWGYNECTATLSGPLFTERLKGFGLFNYYFTRDGNPQPYPGVDVGVVKDPDSKDSIDLHYPAGPRLNSSTQRYSYTGTVSVDFNPLIVRFSGSYSNTVSFSSSPFDYLDPGRIPEFDLWDGFGAAKATYFFNPTTFIELSGGMFYYSDKTMDPVLRDDFWSYGDSSANAQAGYVWQRAPGTATGPYIPPSFITIYNFWFTPPGYPLSSYVKRERNNLSLNAAFSTQLGRSHTLKFGGDYQRYTIRTYQVSSPANLTSLVAQNNVRPDSDPLKVTVTDLMRTIGTNTYGYDLLGNTYDGDDFLGPRHPVFASLYAQDKMELSDLVVNAGLRYDYILTNAYTLVDPSHPELTFDFGTWAVNPAGLRKSSASNNVSPRLGMAFPASDRTVFHVQFARLLQVARLRDLNVGIYALEGMIKGGNNSYPIGFDLRPTSTTQYEIGFSQQIADFASFDITAYYKDIKDQIVMDVFQTAPGSVASNYTVFVNGDFATTKGVELTFTMHRKERLQAIASLSLQDARGSGSYPNSNWAIVTGTTNTGFRPQYIAPLAYDNAVRGNVNLDFRFGKDDGGPVLEQLGASLLFTFNSGHPYTRTASPATGRLAVEPLNSSTTPWVFQLDIKVDKTLRILDQLDLNLYLYVINVLDTKNVENVFPLTGSPSDDGYISDPSSGGKLVKAYGPTYATLYNAYLNYSNPGWFSPVYNWSVPIFYGPPRQIRFGLKLEY
jgi:hypothetical protein